ncbi:hypothetical protein IPM19_02265 [bacterium]|nr:MAG: hypothetical protein IPM19_02265 [bacterium]
MEFWQAHPDTGLIIIVAAFFFPRLTTLFTLDTVPSDPGISLLGFAAWVFIPYFLNAIIATTFYWETNPGLCLIAWGVAIYKTFIEKDD